MIQNAPIHQHPNQSCAFRRTGNLWNWFSSIINTVGKRDNDSDNNWGSDLAPGEVGVDANGEEIINSAGDYEQFLKDMEQAFKDHGLTTEGEDHEWTEEEKQVLLNALGQ